MRELSPHPDASNQVIAVVETPAEHHALVFGMPFLSLRATRMRIEHRLSIDEINYPHELTMPVRWLGNLAQRLNTMTGRYIDPPVDSARREVVNKILQYG